jgi:ferritin-like metal-binding protein YciE
MQERQQTNVPNIYFDLVSVLYNSLQAAQAASAYIQDAQQAGNQQLVQFFQSYQQAANQQAQQVQQILSQVGQSSRGSY